MAETDDRQRGLLEVVTAVLLGLVSVATAIGAFQASAWAGQAGSYLGVAQELRDRNLNTFIASDVALADDGERLFEALDLEFDIMQGTGDPEQLRAQQAVILESATPGLAEAWDDWVASGYAENLFPAATPDYAAAMYAPSSSMNVVSAAVYDRAVSLGDRGMVVTIASVIWAIALLLLGVSGTNVSTRVAGALVIGGAGAFLVGVALVALSAF